MRGRGFELVASSECLSAVAENDFVGGEDDECARAEDEGGADNEVADKVDEHEICFRRFVSWIAHRPLYRE